MFNNNINFDSDIETKNLKKRYCELKKCKINSKLSIRVYSDKKTEEIVIGLNHYLFNEEMLLKSETLIKMLEKLNTLEVL